MKFFIFACIAIIVESSLIAHNTNSLFVPNLLVILAVFSGYSQKKSDILSFILCVTAIIMDMLSVLPFGSAIFSIAAALSVLYVLKSFIPQYTYFYGVVGLFIGTLTYWGALWVYIYGIQIIGMSTFLASSLSLSVVGIISEIAASFIVMTLLYPIRKWIIS